jgi:hypothetical protein
MAHQVRRATVERRKAVSSARNAKQSGPDIEKFHFSVNKTKSGLTRVSINEYKGKLSLDIRHYYYSNEDSDYRPTPKGTSIPLHCGKGFAIKVRKMLEAAAAEGVPGADGEE